MSDIPINAMLAFVLITTYTPGPNNIACASSGILYGYRKTLPFILGIVSAFFLIMLLSGILSSWLNQRLPNFEGLIRSIGALYILWLAYHSLRASYELDAEVREAAGYGRGFLLSALNPKAIVFGLSVHGAFLSPIADDLGLVAIASLILAGVTFTATSTWALFGAAIRRWLRNPKIQLTLNAFLALLLLYTAIEISGLLN